MKKIQVFDQLLGSVKSNCPGLISEEVQAQMKQQFNDAITDIQSQAKADGVEEGQKAGFQAGYEEGKRIAAEKAKAELDKIIEKCDEQAVQKMQNILSILDETNTQKLEEIYQLLQSVKEQSQKDLAEMDADYAEKLQNVADQMNDSKEIALQAQDEDYAEKLETAITAKDEADAEKLQNYADLIDRKHAEQLEEAVNALDKHHALILEQVVQQIDESNSKKLEQVVNLIKESANKRMKKMQLIYEDKLKAEKDKKLDILAESVEKYINYALEQHLPMKQLVSEAKFKTQQQTLEKITDYLKANSIIQESKENVFQDYEKEINDAKSINNKLISEKIELTDKLNRQEAQIVLEQKLKKSTPAQAKFLREYFKNAKSPRIIEESIEDAKASFQKIQSEKRAKLRESLNSKVSTKPSSVVTESTEVKESSKKIAEVKSINNQQPQNIAEYYASYFVKKQ